MTERSMYPEDNVMFSTLSDDANVWLHAANRPLLPEEADRVLSHVTTFRSTWRSHGRLVVSDAELIEDRLLVIAAEVPGGGLSGCGIDKSLHTLDAVALELNFAWVGGLDVVFRDAAGQLQTATRSAFRGLSEAGAVEAQTPVVDLAVSRLLDLRRRGIEVPLASSWHARLLASASDQP